MSRGINKVILVGNLGADPEVKYMPSGDAAANFSVATSDQWKDKSTGEAKEKTEWHRCVAFKRIAEIIGEYLRKGSQVYIEGSLRTRKWQDRDGNDKYTTEIVVREMQMLGGRGGGMSGGGGGSPSGGGGGSPSGGGGGSPSGGGGRPASGGDNDFDDDIPF